MTKPVLNITGMAAILPVGVAVSRERFPTVGAGKAIDGPALHLFLVAVPPFHAAFVRAEFPLLLAGCLRQLGSALLAESVCLVGIAAASDALQVIPAAVGLDRVHRYAQQFAMAVYPLPSERSK